MQNNDVLISQKKVMEITSYSASSLWRRMQDGSFPNNYKIGPNRVAWRLSEVNNWLNSNAGGEV